jgi:hypothetical protein
MGAEILLGEAEHPEYPAIHVRQLRRTTCNETTLEPLSWYYRLMSLHTQRNKTQVT